MPVVATAGHVDHGKSALVRALTGVEPDRWAEERRRGLTIDLGFAALPLDGGAVLSLVDVPGHERFVGNMLAGLAPVPAVLFVVAADQGWRRQSGEHLRAIDALGLTVGLLAVTRTDLADRAQVAATVDDARERIAATSLGEIPWVETSAVTGEGIAALRGALGSLATRLPGPVTTGRARLWVDRSFTIRGSGTVVTGTLGQGSLEVGETVRIGSRAGEHRIRGLQSHDASVASVAAVARTAVNLGGVGAGDIGRGTALLTGDWPLTDLLDVRLRAQEADDLPGELVLHVGTRAVQVRVRPLGAGTVRLRLPEPIPLVAGDRGILRNPGTQHVLAGVEVLDVTPPPLTRRGAAARRAADLIGDPPLLREVSSRGAVRLEDLERLGVDVHDPRGVRSMGEWLVSEGAWSDWATRLRRLLADAAAADPLDPTMSLDAAVRALGLPVRGWLGALAVDADAEVTGGRVRARGVRPDLGPAEAGLTAVEARLAARPFAAPDRDELADAGLGPRELAAAVALGRVLRLPGDVVLLPSAPAYAVRTLAGLPQPFTVSEARQVLDTTRRVAVPLLEHLDERGWTRRRPDGRRGVLGWVDQGVGQVD